MKGSIMPSGRSRRSANRTFGPAIKKQAIDRTTNQESLNQAVQTLAEPPAQPITLLIDDERLPFDNDWQVARTAETGIRLLKEHRNIARLWLDHSLGLGNGTTEPIINHLRSQKLTGKPVIIGTILLVTEDRVAASNQRRKLESLGYAVKDGLLGNNPSNRNRCPECHIIGCKTVDNLPGHETDLLSCERGHKWSA